MYAFCQGCLVASFCAAKYPAAIETAKMIRLVRFILGCRGCCGFLRVTVSGDGNPDKGANQNQCRNNRDAFNVHRFFDVSSVRLYNIGKPMFGGMVRPTGGKSSREFSQSKSR
jgi:hypothetical protein